MEFSTATPIAGAAAASPATKEQKYEKVKALLLSMLNPDERGTALKELADCKDVTQEMAPFVWNSFGVGAMLLQEIIRVYPLLPSPELTIAQSTRVCNALALLQSIACHPETRKEFLNAQFPIYLYPLVNTTGNSRALEYLRLTSLGVLGALVKFDQEPEVMTFLLQTEIVPLCLRALEMGSELSKTVAAFILQKVLHDDDGFEYMCLSADRFLVVCKVLGDTVRQFADKPSSRLMKHILRCYFRFSNEPRVCRTLANHFPETFQSRNFLDSLHGDESTLRCLQMLCHNIETSRSVGLQAGGRFNIKAA